MNKMKINWPKISLWKSVTLLFVGVFLVLGVLGHFFQVRGQTVWGLLSKSVGYVATSTKPVGSGTSFDVPSEPARLRIPSLGIDAVVQSVGLSTKGDGSMGIPTNFKDVAWYNKGAVPGMPGSAVIAGHLDGKDVPKAVFYDLGSLKIGELIEVVDQDDQIFSFRVVDRKIYNYDDSAKEVFSQNDSKIRLNLITCSGDWIKSEKIYTKRTVVFTELISS